MRGNIRLIVSARRKAVKIPGMIKLLVMSRKRSWSRSEKLTAGGLLVAIVGAGITLLTVPEARRALHLEKTATVPAVAAVLTPAEPVKPVVPQENPQPKPKVHQQAKSSTVGKRNVTRNNVAGNGNAVGNNNQVNTSTNGAAMGSITQGPGSIAQIGGTGNQATVNNYAPPPRRLGQQHDFAECIRAKPGRFSIGSISNNGEAYRYAQDWRDVFTSAEWEIEHKDIPIQIFLIGGGMWSGVQIRVHDASTIEGHAALADDSPEKNFYECASKAVLPPTTTVIPSKDIPTGTVHVSVSEQPTQ